MASVDVTLKVPPSLYQMATDLVDPFDEELFKAPRALVPLAASKRRRPSSSATEGAGGRQRRSTTLSSSTTNATMPVESSAERKARVFVQTQLEQLRREEEQRLGSDNTAVNHSIAGGSYVSGRCPVLEVVSVFSDINNKAGMREEIKDSFKACLQLIAIQAYNVKADERRGQKMLSGIALDEEYMKLLVRADFFCVWRLRFFVSLLKNIGDAALEQLAREASVDAEPHESIATLHPLPMQKFLGYMLWVPIPASEDNLAGKKNCYTCSTPLREGQSSCYKTVRLSCKDRTGTPRCHSDADVNAMECDNSVADASGGSGVSRITPEIVGPNDADQFVHFQICSSCHESVGLWLSMRDIFRSERNNATKEVTQMAKSYAAQNKRLTCAEFVRVYLGTRDPTSIWNDVYKCLRTLVNSFGMFLRSACDESTARCMGDLFYNIFPNADPRSNPLKKPVDPPSRATQVTSEMLSKSVEDRLRYLHRLMDPNATEDIGAVWRTLRHSHSS